MTLHAGDSEPNLPRTRADDVVAPRERAANPPRRLIRQRLRERNWSYARPFAALVESLRHKAGLDRHGR